MGYRKLTIMVLSGMIGSCSPAERQAVVKAAHSSEIVIAKDCKALEGDTLVPGSVRLACELADGVVYMMLSKEAWDAARK